jgi:NADPH:quinone reductase-like Zn-dependent oxidoreductase
MQAVTYRKYGGPDVLNIEPIAKPALKSGHVIVQVHASSVSTADWRLRAAAFPKIMQVPGRLMFGNV